MAHTHLTRWAQKLRSGGGGGGGVGSGGGDGGVGNGGSQTLQRLLILR